MSFPFDNTYARLPARFFSPVAPTAVRAPRVVKVNRPLATLLGLDADALAGPKGAEWLSGNAVPDGATPIALAYAGHQFGHFAGQLGDGRAILLGEIVGTDGRRRDVQLKGAGPTPYSRRGDGRAALGPVLREYLVSEAMAVLGVPTTRALAAVTTGEPVLREEPLPGGVMVRVAASHLRVGTFELFAAREDLEGLKTLTAYALERHYPGAAPGPLSLLEQVIAAQASLVARWMGLGFIHGVMNTDNTSISGETIDYGPCAFLDEFNPVKTFSSIDHHGRYAYGNQPRIMLWNLTRLAEALLPIIDPDEAKAVPLVQAKLEAFGPQFQAHYRRVMRAKLGLEKEEEGDLELIDDLFGKLALRETDFTRFFRELSHAAADTSRDPEGYSDFLPKWRERIAREGVTAAEVSERMKRTNPAFIPRNHKVEEVLEAAVRRDDFAPFETFCRVLERPFDDQPEHAAWREPPKAAERVKATFCGT